MPEGKNDGKEKKMGPSSKVRRNRITSKITIGARFKREGKAKKTGKRGRTGELGGGVHLGHRTRLLEGKSKRKMSVNRRQKNRKGFLRKSQPFSGTDNIPAESSLFYTKASEKEVSSIG